MASKEGKLRKVKSFKGWTVDENGESRADADLVLWLDPTGDTAFVMEVPQYVADALNVNVRVKAPTAELVKSRHKETMTQYQEHVRTAIAEDVLLVRIDYTGIEPGDSGRRIYSPDTFRGSSLGSSELHNAVGVRVGFQRAYRVNGKIHVRERDYDDHTKFKPGRVTHIRDVQVWTWSQELEDKLTQVQLAIDQAVNVLHGIATAQDPRQALLALAAGGRLLQAPEK
jgi:hypothetical protein